MSGNQTKLSLDLNILHEKRIKYLKMQIKQMQNEIDLIKEHIDKR